MTELSRTTKAVQDFTLAARNEVSISFFTGVGWAYACGSLQSLLCDAIARLSEDERNNMLDIIERMTKRMTKEAA